LITASRLDTDPRWEDKGAARMVKLAEMLEENGIDYEWGYFADTPLSKTPRGMVFHKAVSNIKDYIAEADYLVQLSSEEAFCYSVVEALEIGTPVPGLENVKPESTITINYRTITGEIGSKQITLDSVPKYYEFKYNTKEFI
jgi:glycosyltransferase involved in cell wall biosynthesis